MIGMANAAAMSQMVQRDHHQQMNNAQLNWGAKNGTINRDEYVSLGNYQNETSRLRGLYEKDGLNAREQRLLANREKQYDKMYQKYIYGDYHPRTKGKDDIQNRQINQLGRIYDGVSSGQVTMREGQGLLNQQQNISHVKGHHQQDGLFFNRLNPNERRDLNHRLDHASGNIHHAKHNWSNDWNQWMGGMF